MGPKTQSRYRDDRLFLHQFADEFLVVCPRCRKCARVTILAQPERGTFAPRRLLCPSCAYSKDIEVRGYSERPDRDWYFGCPLWLGIRCAGGQIWAYNYRHLAWLESYVRATVRDNRPDPKSGWSSRNAVSRLPEWIKSAKNRRAILQGIAKLRRKSLSTKDGPLTV